MISDSDSESSSDETSSYSSVNDANNEENIPANNINVVKNLFNRQLYGRFAKNSRGPALKLYNEIPDRCQYFLSEILPKNEPNIFQHVIMGFSQCGRFLISYYWKCFQHTNINVLFPQVKYNLCIWSVTVPRKRATKVAEHQLFRHYKGSLMLDSITLAQWPKDNERLVIYGTSTSCQSEGYLTIISLPAMRRCNDCSLESANFNSSSPLPLQQETNRATGLIGSSQVRCLRHGVCIDSMLPIMPPYPKFNPEMSLAYPDHIILNTGHYLYVLKVTVDQNLTYYPSAVKSNLPSNLSNTSSIGTISPRRQISTPVSYPDSLSDISSEGGVASSLSQHCQDYLTDISDCETESSFATDNKPFHEFELNISCEPSLNVTQRSYDTTNVQPMKMFLHKNDNNKKTEQLGTPTSQSPQTADIKKVLSYEFTDEEMEEPLRPTETFVSFRKRRLAEKKYEFSEDNCENIVPLSTLRTQRRFRKNKLFLRNVIAGAACPLSSPPLPADVFTQQNKSSASQSSHSSSTFSPGFFMSSRENRLRSPSYSNRKSPISPRMYNPSHIDLEQDDSKLILRQITNNITNKVLESKISAHSQLDGLLIIDNERTTSKTKVPLQEQCVKEFIRRYTVQDFETTSSRLSETQRDDCLSIELPILVFATQPCGEEYNLEAMPNNMPNKFTGPGITVIHRMFDAETFINQKTPKICFDNDLIYTFCADYDIEIVDVCPLSGYITCTAYLEVSADVIGQLIPSTRMHLIQFMFIWKATDPHGGVCRILDDRINVVPKNRLVEKTRSTTNIVDDSKKCNFNLFKNLQRLPNKINVMYMHPDSESLTILKNDDHLIQITLDKPEDLILEDYEDGISSQDET